MHRQNSRCIQDEPGVDASSLVTPKWTHRAEDWGSLTVSTTGTTSMNKWSVILFQSIKHTLKESMGQEDSPLMDRLGKCLPVLERESNVLAAVNTTTRERERDGKLVYIKIKSGLAKVSLKSQERCCCQRTTTKGLLSFEHREWLWISKRKTVTVCLGDMAALGTPTYVPSHPSVLPQASKV